MGEAFSRVEKTGADRQVVRDILTADLFSCPAYDNYSRLIVDRAYDNVGFTATLALKDVNLALAAGEALQVPLPSAMVCRDRLMSAVTHGNAEKDWSVMARSEEHTSELQSLMRTSYAVFCLKKQNKTTRSI